MGEAVSVGVRVRVRAFRKPRGGVRVCVWSACRQPAAVARTR